MLVGRWAFIIVILLTIFYSTHLEVSLLYFMYLLILYISYVLNLRSDDYILLLGASMFLKYRFIIL